MPAGPDIGHAGRYVALRIRLPRAVIVGHREPDDDLVPSMVTVT
jgi:hypothetical protein